VRTGTDDKPEVWYHTVVRETGGLKDTVVDIEEDPDRGNGFTFKDLTPKDFINTLERAVYVYRNEPGLWLDMVRRGMRLDFSWENSAKKILKYLQYGFEGIT